EAVPEWASASLALNTSATFAGQALGTLTGGIVIEHAGVEFLPWAAALLAVATLCILGLASYNATARVPGVDAQY
ncbi:MAG: hypothetical protein K2Z81_10975, partial [Cyanobacteria bacterium]|nr:hypothetical protein [Cyanobacteriota bacterium]